MKLNAIPSLRAFLFLLALSLPFASVGAYASSEKEIDARVDAAVDMFKKDVKKADEYLKGAAGVLVFPNVKKAGVVMAGQAGEGALRVNGKTVGYYDLSSASLGFQAGYQEANLVFLFLTQEALDNFISSQGWSTGVETGITVVEKGTGVSLDTLKAKSSVAAFAFGRKGLMAGWSLKGMKISKRQEKDKQSAQ